MQDHKRDFIITFLTLKKKIPAKSWSCLDLLKLSRHPRHFHKYHNSSSFGKQGRGKKRITITLHCNMKTHHLSTTFKHSRSFSTATFGCKVEETWNGRRKSDGHIPSFSSKEQFASKSAVNWSTITDFLFGCFRQSRMRNRSALPPIEGVVSLHNFQQNDRVELSCTVILRVKRSITSKHRSLNYTTIVVLYTWSSLHRGCLLIV